jgi:hypothetical protein
MNLAPIFLLEIIKYEGLTMSQYVREWTESNDTGGGGSFIEKPSAYNSLNPCRDYCAF